MPRATGTKPIEVIETSEGQGLSFDGLDDLLGFRLRQASVVMYRDFTSELAGIDVTQKQTATLWLISANPGVSQASIASSLDVDRATIMGLVDRLEVRGLVIRKRSKSDRRRQELYLTPAGQNTLRKTKGLIAKHERRFTAHFTAAELSTLLAALQIVTGGS